MITFAELLSGLLLLWPTNQSATSFDVWEVRTTGITVHSGVNPGLVVENISAPRAFFYVPIDQAGVPGSPSSYSYTHFVQLTISPGDRGVIYNSDNLTNWLECQQVLWGGVFYFPIDPATNYRFYRYERATF